MSPKTVKYVELRWWAHRAMVTWQPLDPHTMCVFFVSEADARKVDWPPKEDR